MGRWLIQTDEQLIERIKARCIITLKGCWEYHGNRNRLGYGQASFRNQKWMVHRFMYWLIKGPFPLELEILHRCDNPPCCNPDHLNAGTQRDNLADCLQKGRHRNAAATHCLRGHEFTPENTRVNKCGSRSCRTCDRIKERLRAGWTLEQAENLPKTPHGLRPVNGKLPGKVGRRLKVVCIHGHPLIGENLYITSEGRRRCRACHHRHVRRSVQKWQQSSATTAP